MRSVRDSPLSDVWRLIPVELPSTLSRLAYLAWGRDPNSGRYADPALEGKFSAEEIDRLLRSAHESVFSEWMGYSLEEQQADLTLYFAGLDCPRRQALETWKRLEPYRLFIPASAWEAEKRLFLCDLETLLAVMWNELSPEAKAAAPADWRVRKVLEHIESRGGHVRLTLKEISPELRISPTHLGHLFKQATGRAFRDYLRLVRMQRAIKLLADPKLTVAEVAAALGHDNPSNFVQEFHVYSGFRPGEYRDMVVSGIPAPPSA
jgi:AraC-like DNA-binding protein